MEGFENNDISVKLLFFIKGCGKIKDMFLQLSWFE